jgi:hypothetical protein
MKKKECPNPIIISSNIGVENLVKKMLLSAPYINPPFAFPVAKEKRKCISASTRTEYIYILYILFIYFLRPCRRDQCPQGRIFFFPRLRRRALRPGGHLWIRADGAYVRADAPPRPSECCRLGGCTHASTRIEPASEQTRRFTH